MKLKKKAEKRGQIKGYLDELQNSYGDFDVTILEKDKDGEQKARLAWKKYCECANNEALCERLNNRTILDVEIVLDLEDPSKYEELIKQLDEAKYKYRAFFTGSKGYHIHMIFPELRDMEPDKRKSVKEYMISKYGCDIQKAGNRCMIALEYSQHWKGTGKAKTLIKEVEGYNLLNGLMCEMRENSKFKDLEKSGYIFDESEVYKEGIFPVCQLMEDELGFGFLYPKWKTVYDYKDRPIGKKQVKVPVMVTSKREFYEVGMEMETKYKTQFENVPGKYPLRWSLSSLKEFLEGHAPDIDSMELYSKMKEQYKRYMYFSQDIWYKVHTLWDLGTYFFMLFRYYPLMEMRGQHGTAKSKVMTISRMMTFNATEEMTNPSPPSLFRPTHELRPTKYIDEAEKLFVQQKGKIEIDDRAELINSSYKYTGCVPRQDKIGNKYVTVYYSTYSPTMICSINGLFGATEDRAIVHITVKAPKGDKRNRMSPAEQDKIWQEIRNEEYLYAMQSWREVKAIYDCLDVKDKLDSRDFELWRPLLSLAKHIDPSDDLFKEVLNFAAEVTELKEGDRIPETSNQYQMLKNMYELILEGKNPVYLKDIRARFYDSEWKPSEITIQRKLDVLGFKDFRHHFKSGSGYDIGKLDFDKIVVTVCPSLIHTDQMAIPASRASRASPITEFIEEKVVSSKVTLGDARDARGSISADSGYNMVTLGDGGDARLFDEKHASVTYFIDDRHFKSDARDAQNAKIWGRADIVKFVEENDRLGNVDLIERKFGEDAISRLLETGDLFIAKPDWVKVLK